MSLNETDRSSRFDQTNGAGSPDTYTVNISAWVCKLKETVADL